MIRLLATIARLAPLLASGGLCRGEWVEMALTAYSPTCGHCVNKRRPDGIGAAGVRIKPGLHLAADPSIPFGTRIYVMGAWWSVQDRGGKVKGDRLDLALSSHRKAKKFGVKREKVWLE